MPLTDAALTEELAPVVAGLVDRHLENSKEWFPHRIVPWGRGEDLGRGWEWDPNETQLSEEVRSALIVDLLTEDNLPPRSRPGPCGPARARPGRRLG